MLPPRSSQCLCFMGVMARFQSLLCSFTCSVSSVCGLFLLLVFKLYLVCKWVVWKNWTPRRVTVCFSPTRTFLPSSLHNYPLPRELAYGMRWDLWSHQRLRLVLPGGALKSELQCLLGVPQFQSQGIPCLKPSFSSHREFPSPFNVTKASKC